MILSFTGHRPNHKLMGGYKTPNPVHTKIQNIIKEYLIKNQPERIVSGMALGVDQIAANLAVELEIPLTAAIPFLGQEKVWPEKAQEKYKDLVNKASQVIYICTPGYHPSKMQKRNEWMVDNSDALFAVYDGSGKGGTANCFNYALKQNKKIILLDLNSFSLNNAGT